MFFSGKFAPTGGIELMSSPHTFPRAVFFTGKVRTGSDGIETGSDRFRQVQTGSDGHGQVRDRFEMKRSTCVASFVDDDDERDHNSCINYVRNERMKVFCGKSIGTSH